MSSVAEVVSLPSEVAPPLALPLLLPHDASMSAEIEMDAEEMSHARRVVMMMLLWLSPTGLDPLFGLIDDDRDDNRSAHNDLIVTLVNTEDDHGVVDKLDDDGPEDGSECGASTAHERCAADDGGCDDLELVRIARVGFCSTEVSKVDTSSEISSKLPRVHS